MMMEGSLQSNQSLLEENRRLSEELAQCKADKEFVWLLWKQLQKQSPDLTSTVDMVVTREKLKTEQRNREFLSSLETKDKEIASLQSLVDNKQQEIADQNLRLIQTKSEVNLLERKLEAQQLETEKHSKRAEEVIAECQRLRERCGSLEELGLQREQNEQELRRNISVLEGDLREKQHLVEEHARKEQQIETLQEELSQLGDKMSQLSAECSSSLDCCMGMDRQLKLKERQLLKAKEMNKTKDSAIKQLRDELRESTNSCDAWANHTTLQTSAIQRLQAENGQLRADLTSKEERLHSLSESIQQLTSQLEELKEQNQCFEAKSSGSPACGEDVRSQAVGYRTGEDKRDEVSRLSGLLERTEKELFEARTQLDAKSEELQSLRCSHDRRLQRMRALQASHRLVVQQLKTYETRSSPHCKKSPLREPRVKSAGRGLRQEDSEAVWNELSRYRNRCEEMEKEMLQLEEERDTLQVRCTRNHTTIAELRACLQNEKDDLERKIAAIAEVDSTLSSTSTQEQKVIELEGTLAQVQYEKKHLLAQYRSVDRECFQLREEVTQLQSAIMQLKHQAKLGKLKRLCKSTMTEPPYETALRDSSSLTDSATQVDMTPLSHQKPETRDAQVSPVHPWNIPLSSTSQVDVFTEDSPIHSSSVTKSPTYSHRRGHERSHSRSHSDGEILIHKRRAQNALERVQVLSRSFQKEPPSTTDNGGCSSVVIGVDGVTKPQSSTATSTQMQHGVQPQVKVHSYSDNSRLPQVQKLPDSLAVERVKSCKRSSLSNHAGPHKCVWQQQVKSLQQRLKTLTKQVTMLNASKHTLSQSLAEERAAAEKAGSEARELGQRLQGCKANIHSLHEELQKLTVNNQELQQKCQLLESEGRKTSQGAGGTDAGKSEPEWRRLEAERKALTERCNSLNRSLKSLEEQLSAKTGELIQMQDKCVRQERDVKRKRQLIEDQRHKLKQARDDISKEQEKMHTLATEVKTQGESGEENKLKVESLRLQLNRQKAEKEKLMGMLSECQEELAHTLRQLSTCEEDCNRKKHLTTQTKLAFQVKLDTLNQEHAEKLSQLGTQLRVKEKLVQEFEQFTKSLAMELELKRLARRRQKGREKESAGVISTRAREIARSALNFSDLELDEFFSDIEQNGEDVHCGGTFRDHVSTIAGTKPPFAAELVRTFVDFVQQTE